ncbi:carbohydrate kinase family protein [Oceanomicrobium pacificus]|uniref:carbohydrate kinase family protein n=1 Tax=Oceanomicrobium pacificus TaxID=2692916 RepID=UPI0019676F8B
MFDFFLDEEDGPGAATYQARAGGSPFNVAIGLSRLGQRSGLLTGMSTDMLGQRLRQVLEAEGVETGYLVDTDRKTTISLVGLDAEGSPAYQFYGQNSADVSLTIDELPPLGDEVMGLHLGSYSIAARPVADALEQAVSWARARFISLDPNVRPTVEPDMEIWADRIARLLPYADLIKISREDMDIVYPGRAPADLAADWMAAGVHVVIVTDGGDAVHGWTRDGSNVSVTPPKIKVVDAVGAGDTFQAAILAELGIDGDPLGAIAALDAERFETLLRYAATAAAVTCTRRGADMPRRDDIKIEG